VATVILIDQDADATSDPHVAVLEQVAESDSLAACVITEQYAEQGGGSLALARITDMYAQALTPHYAPASMAMAAGGRWLPVYLRAGDGSGTWS
jgi:hypothetical protein